HAGGVPQVLHQSPGADRMAGGQDAIRAACPDARQRGAAGPAAPFGGGNTLRRTASPGRCTATRNRNMHAARRQSIRLSGGTELSFVVAGNPSLPAVLLLHGFPASARTFRAVWPRLSQVAHVIAPDLPGFGQSDVLPTPSFPAFGDAMLELLDRLAIGPRHLYLHDFGAPVGLHVAMHAPELVSGLI